MIERAGLIVMVNGKIHQVWLTEQQAKFVLNVVAEFHGGTISVNPVPLETVEFDIADPLPTEMRVAQ